MIALILLNVILAIASIFIPILGGYLTIISGILTLFFPGRHYILALFISGLNLANILFMSPFLRTNAAIAMQYHDGKWVLAYVGIAVFHGIVALFIYFKYLRLRKKKGHVTKNIFIKTKSRGRKSISPGEVPPGFHLDDPDGVFVTPVDLPEPEEVMPRPKAKPGADKPMKQA
ncbi:MAG: hypothetical protein HQL77_00835 [Magnetococcales bacterium]|nr:hypothetical protein [Magnetococcales bacterium]